MAVFDKLMSGANTGLGIANLIGSLYMNKKNLDYQREINDNLTGSQLQAFQLNSQEAQAARDWNLQVDNTKYQRQVADMKAAGVNPALAMTGGVSTQAGSNAMASGVSGNAVAPRNDINAFSQAVSSMMNYQVMKAQKENIEADTRGKNIENTTKGEINALEVLKRKEEISNLIKDGKYKDLVNEWYPEITETNLNETNHRIDKLVEDIGLTKTQNLISAVDYAMKQFEAEHQGERFTAEISKMSAEERSAAANAWKNNVEAAYEAANGRHLPGSMWSDIVSLVSDATGIKTSDLFGPGKSVVEKKLLGRKWKNDNEWKMLHPVSYFLNHRR